MLLHGFRTVGLRAGRPCLPAVSEILSVIMITVALAVGTGIFLYAYHDRHDVTEEATLGHMELSRMRASELVTWSSASCRTNIDELGFLLHNYGADDLSTENLRAFVTWRDVTRELNQSLISYSGLSDGNNDPDVATVGGGETVWVDVPMGCGSVPWAMHTPGLPFSWECANPRFNDDSFSCRQSTVLFVTPAEDVITVESDSRVDTSRLPTAPVVSDCRPPPRVWGNTTICFDVSNQPSPITRVEVWHVGQGNFPGATAPIEWTGAVSYEDADTACASLDLNRGISRFRLVSDEGASLFAQRPYTHVSHGDGACLVRHMDRSNVLYCSDGSTHTDDGGGLTHGMCR